MAVTKEPQRARKMRATRENEGNTGTDLVLVGVSVGVAVSLTTLAAPQAVEVGASLVLAAGLDHVALRVYRQEVSADEWLSSSRLLVCSWLAASALIVAHADNSKGETVSESWVQDTECKGSG